jgi:hypothetical protein
LEATRTFLVNRSGDLASPAEVKFPVNLGTVKVITVDSVSQQQSGTMLQFSLEERLESRVTNGDVIE